MQDYFGALQQSHLANSLQQYQANTLGSLLGQQSTLMGLSQLSSYANAYPPADPDLAAREARAFAMRLAEESAERGHKIISRISFWSAFGWPARWLVNRLVAQLDRITDEMEHQLAAAA
jgi:hypothetical protein